MHCWIFDTTRCPNNAAVWFQEKGRGKATRCRWLLRRRRRISLAHFARVVRGIASVSATRWTTHKTDVIVCYSTPLILRRIHSKPKQKTVYSLAKMKGLRYWQKFNLEISQRSFPLLIWKFQFSAAKIFRYLHAPRSQLKNPGLLGHNWETQCCRSVPFHLKILVLIEFLFLCSRINFPAFFQEQTSQIKVGLFRHEINL